MSGGFDASHPFIAHDAARPDDPRTVFALLLAGLKRRRARGIPSFTVLSCDNLPENGHVARQAMLGLAGMISPALRDGVAANVAFPNSMVDCITPTTSEREREMVADRFGIDDAAPVVCERFRQWVIEDNFPLGRPPSEHVGVEFVDHVAPSETMKLRILNAGHAAIAYPSALLGHDFVHDAMNDPDVARWLDQLMRREVLPVLDPVPGVDFDRYLHTCIERFSNPAIGDTTARLCGDGSNRQPQFVLPTIADALSRGTPVDGLALEVAFWCRYCGTIDSAATLADPRADRLMTAARTAERDPAALLALPDIFGDIGDWPRFADAFARQLRLLIADGPRAALRRFSGLVEA